ncbi:MAG: CRISPR-associated protein Cas4 [Chloroflexi bacterium]|nr:MAG: CRISPR-associated protein Cas4 [Chloroflexota bacterium]
MFWILLGLGLILLLAGFAVRHWGHRAQAQTGLPVGEVVYSDTGAWQAVEKPLISRRYGLVGKPDYLVRVQAAGGALLVPVEVKSRTQPAVTPAGHLLQLAAYCLLVEETQKARPPYGLLHYADATLQIPYTDALRQAALDAAQAIRQARHAADVHRSHDDPARCRGCGYRHACDEALAE